MKTKPIIVIALIAVAVFLAAYFISPVFAVRSLVSAAREGDEVRLEQMVDFPAFRASVKEELNASLMAEMRDRAGAGSSLLGSLGMMLAPGLIDGAVETLVTPSAIAAMVQNARTPDPRDVVVDPAPPPQTEAPVEDDTDRIHQSYGYRDLNTFVLTLTREDRPDRSLDLLMERRGLFGWQLAGLDLSDDPDNP